jgi:uncharacterized protein (DUF4415 family)
MATEARIRANTKYDKNNTTQIKLKLNNKTDSDILEYLQKCDNKQGLIKDAIREYIKAL